MTFCHDCGYNLSLGDEKFCSHCGTKLQDEVKTVEVKNEKEIIIERNKGDNFGIGFHGNNNNVEKNVKEFNVSKIVNEGNRAPSQFYESSSNPFTSGLTTNKKYNKKNQHDVTSFSNN
jgi:hypothetical protein